MTTRVYGKRITINSENAKEFWEDRAAHPIDLKTVLLGEDKKNGAQEKRNDKEKSILLSVVGNSQKLNILDIGCGIGRWADNLYERIESYTGIDYSKGFVDYANKKYSNDKNINFFEMSACDIDDSICANNYNLIICTGVLTYINDADISKVFNAFSKITPEYVYIQESISLMDVRLTLDNFESKELKTNYSAIYRTREEYEEYFKENHFEILKTDLLLDNEIGGREETNARYWVLKGEK